MISASCFRDKLLKQMSLVDGLGNVFSEVPSNADFTVIITTLLERPRLLESTEMLEVFTALLPTSDEGICNDESVIWHLARGQESRPALLKMLVSVPKLLENEPMLTALTALPTRASGRHENKSAIWWLAANCDTRASLMKILVDHSELFQTMAMQAALTALPASAAGANENRSAIWWLAAGCDTRAPLIKILVDHFELFQTMAMQTALTALPTGSARADESKSAICYLVDQHQSREALLIFLDDRAELPDKICSIRLKIYIRVIEERQNSFSSFLSLFFGGSRERNSLSIASAEALIKIVNDNEEEIILTDDQLLACAEDKSLNNIISRNATLKEAVYKQNMRGVDYASKDESLNL